MTRSAVGRRTAAATAVVGAAAALVLSSSGGDVSDPALHGGVVTASSDGLGPDIVPGAVVLGA